jgi:hypothetical protein
VYIKLVIEVLEWKPAIQSAYRKLPKTRQLLLAQISPLRLVAFACCKRAVFSGML